MDNLCIYQGKVRDIYRMGEDYLLMKATDRVSSFDKHIGIIPGKGKLLNKMSEYWFNTTKHIIGNHLLATEDSYMLVKKCIPYKIELVIRGYITGNTSTSLWTHYNNGERVYCGIQFPEGLKKHQKLVKPVITPTTKGKIDRPISKEEIIREGYMTAAECIFIYTRAYELFAHGQKIADQAGFILVDTKYEFGKTLDGKIILIDEVHTCDSSRYWLKDTYESKFKQGLEPDKLDKDCVRDWVKSVCNPYTDTIPEIPQPIIQKAFDNYKFFYDSISSIDATVNMKNIVIIISGSEKDRHHVLNIIKELKHEKIAVVPIVASAHKNTMKVLGLINCYNNDPRNIIFVTVAGRSNALSGVVAANSIHPVIACPPYANKTDMMVNLHSTLQCPSKVPVMTILEPGNVALAIKRIFKLQK